MVDCRRIRLLDRVAVRHFDDQAVLLNLETGQYHGLDATGAEFLRALEGGATFAEALVPLAVQFADADVERLREDLGKFCGQLDKRRLIALEGDGWR